MKARRAILLLLVALALWRPGAQAHMAADIALPQPVDHPATLPTADVYFTPELYLVTPGAVFAVTVAIQDASEIGGFQFDLLYNPAFLQADNAVMGAFLASTGRSVGAVGPEINRAAGTMRFGAFSFGSMPGPSGNGVLAQMHFTALADGATRLNLANLRVVDSSITPQEQPAQSAAALAAVGAALQTIQPLSIVSSANGVRLGWPHSVSTAATYEVWRGTTPYLIPGGLGATRQAILTPASGNLTWDDVALPDGNYFYRVWGLDADSTPISLSGSVGRFNFVLQPGQ
ncbi:MAG: cohesin domain-containing protein [Chloroflexi bacterium]|nr:cohesin domain-containing protein [Chloroflexota bacterium]